MVIHVRNLAYSYPNSKVLEGISFDVKEKDFVAVIGPNGAGKSTLLKLLLGLLKKTDGTLELFGIPIEHFKSWNDVGYVPQRFTIDPLFPGSVREILGLEGDQANPPLELELEPLLDMQFKSLSGGQQQRVLIARALAKNPKLLFLDEPSVGVDFKTQQQFYSLLRRLNKEGMTILLVTHDIGMIPNCCKSVLCINRTVCCYDKASRAGKILKQVYGSEFNVHDHGDHHAH